MQPSSLPSLEHFDHLRKNCVRYIWFHPYTHTPQTTQPITDLLSVSIGLLYEWSSIIITCGLLCLVSFIHYNAYNVHSCCWMFQYDSFLFPGGSDSKASAYSGGDLSSVPGLGITPGEGNGNPLQYSCLENPMGYSPWGCKGSDMTRRLHFFMPKQYSFVWIYHILFIHLSVGHSGIWLL